MESDSEQPKEVVIGNLSQLSRRVARSFWWLWSIPLVVLIGLVVAHIADNRAEENERRQAVERERDERAVSLPIEGEGYRLAGAYCVHTAEDATYSATLTNTSPETRSYSINVNVVDEEGTRIGEAFASISELEAGGSGNFRTATDLARFVDGPAADSCLVGIKRSDLDSPLIQLPPIEILEGDGS